MKVKHLIEELRKFPNNLDVLIPASEEGANPIECVFDSQALKCKFDPHFANGNYTWENYRDFTRGFVVVILSHNKEDQKDAS